MNIKRTKIATVKKILLKDPDMLKRGIDTPVELINYLINSYINEHDDKC